MIELIEHILYISKKQAKTIQRFEIDMLGRSKESFSDFDDEFDVLIVDPPYEVSLGNKIKDGIVNLR